MNFYLLKKALSIMNFYLKEKKRKHQYFYRKNLDMEEFEKMPKKPLKCVKLNDIFKFINTSYSLHILKSIKKIRRWQFTAFEDFNRFKC